MSWFLLGSNRKYCAFDVKSRKICEETAGRQFTALSSTKLEQVEALVSPPRRLKPGSHKK
jgi:hypothetical protein